MTAQLSVNMTADEADLFAKLTTLIAKTAESEAAFKKVTETSAQAAQATKEAAAQAEAVARATANAAKEQDNFAAAGKRLSDQLIRANETLSESYERQQSQLKAAFDAGRLGATEYEKSLSLLKTRNDEMQTAQARAALESSEAHKAARKEAEAGIKLAEQMIRASETVEDAYSRQAAQLKAAFDAGRLGAADYEKALGLLKSRTEEVQTAQARAALESTESYQKLRKEQEAGVSTVERLRNSTISLEDKYKQLAAEVTKAHQAGRITSEEHAAALKQLDAEYRDLSQSQAEVMGDSFEQKAVNMVAQWGSVAAAVKVLNDELRIKNDLINSGIQQLKAGERGLKDLVTVSGGNPVLLAEMQMQVEGLQTQEGMDPDSAARVVMGLMSAGLIGADKAQAENDQAVKFFGRLNRFTDPNALVGAAEQMDKAFGLPYQQAVDLTLQASTTSSFTAAELAKQLATASAGSSNFTGADPRQTAIETAAIVSAFSGKHKEGTGTLANSAMIKLAQNFPDLTPIEAAERALSMPEDERKAMLGNDQSMFLFLGDIEAKADEIESLVNDLTAATDRSGTGQATSSVFARAADGNISLRGLRELSAAKQREAVSTANFAGIGIKNEIAATDMRTSLNRGHKAIPFLSRGLQEMALNVVHTGANLFDLPLRGGDSLQQARERDSRFRSDAMSIRAGMDPELRQTGDVPGFTRDENAQYLRDVQERQLRELERIGNQAPPVTRPGDDR